MEKLFIALTGAVTIAGAVLFLFGVNIYDKNPPVPPMPSPPPMSSVPAPAAAPPLPAQTAEAPQQLEALQLVCKECPNPAEPTVLEQDGVSVTVSATPVPAQQADPGAPATAKVRVKVQSKQPAKIMPKQNYVVLSPESGGRDYSLPLSEYRFVTPDGQTSSHTTAPDDPEMTVADSWPTVDETVESELEFQFNLDLLSGRFMVRPPDLMVNGKSYALPPVTFEPKTP